jgi:hypothetical protein
MPINYELYPDNWDEIRIDILTRAHNRCEKCGVNYWSWVVKPDGKQYQVVLTIAHVDHDRTNNDYENLKAWCQRCHILHDVGQRVFSRKYGKETQYQCGKLF